MTNKKIKLVSIGDKVLKSNNDMMGAVTSQEAKERKEKERVSKLIKKQTSNRWNLHKLHAEINLTGGDDNITRTVLSKEVHNLDEAAGLLYETVSSQKFCCMTYNTELYLSPINGENFLSMALDQYGNVCVIEKGWILVPYSEWRDSSKAEEFQYYIS